MTSTFSVKDDFFDFPSDDDYHDGPNLTGEYNRGNTPPSARTTSVNKQSAKHPSASAGSSTSGHFSSDSNMSKSKDYPSKDNFDNRSRSRSPAGSNYSHRYSDSFDSEDSGGDSRGNSPSSRTTRGRGGKNSGKESARRFDSGTSRDSRSTFRSTYSSGYGKQNKKGFQKSSPKKGRGRGRPSSIASSTQKSTTSPRGNETTKRMLSAKGHTINRIRNEYEVLKTKHDELQREFKLQKEIHRKNARELDKYTHQEEQLPQLMKAQSTELEHYHKKCNSYRERERQKDQQIKQYVNKLNRTEDELKEARVLLEDKGLKERAELQKERDELQEKIGETERRLEDVEKYLSHMKKNQKHERREWMHNQKEYKGQIEQLHIENEKLQLQLREKEKELEIKNIYSNRIAKASPGRLSINGHSPTALRPITFHKSTTTDEIKLDSSSPRRPHPPAAETTKRAVSAEERVVQDSSVVRTTKSPRDERNRRKAEEKREKERLDKEESIVKVTAEKKELSEHERILMELDSGFKKPEGSKVKAEEDETDRILRQFDDHSNMKGNVSSRQQTEEAERRRKEEERKRQERLREEEEERRKQEQEDEERRRKEDEAKKPMWLKTATTTTITTVANTITSSTTSSSSGYTPSTFGYGAGSAWGQGGQARGQAGQKKATTTSKLPWLAGGDSPPSKPEQENKQKEQDAKPSPRKTPTLNVSDEEEDYPFFGSKPTAAASNPKPSSQQPSKIPFAVNSVRGLQKYSASRESPPPAANGAKPSGEYNGLFASKPARNATTTQDDAKTAQDKRELEAKEAEERHKKDELLAKMRQIDDGEKPDSGRSRRSYNHTDPVKNMHNGLPSHPDVSVQKGRKKSFDSDDLTFGSYAPTFSSGAKPAPKAAPKKKNPFFDNDSDAGFVGSPKQSPQRVAKKTSLMTDLFGNGSDKSDVPSNGSKSDHPSRSSFGEDNIFSASTKAKPVADTGVYPWEKKVNVGSGEGGKPLMSNGNAFGGGQKMAGRVTTSYSDDLDDDLEEMTL